MKFNFLIKCLLLVAFSFSAQAELKNVVFHGPSCKSLFRNNKAATEDLLKSFEKIESITSEDFGVFHTEYWLNKPVDHLYKHILSIKYKQLRMLEELANDTRFSKSHSQILRVAMQKLEDSREIEKLNLKDKQSALPRRIKWGSLSKLAIDNYEYNAYYANLKGFYLKSKAVLTEARVALQAGNISALEIRNKSILHNLEIRLSEKERKNERLLHALELEIDVAANAYRDLIEVKTFNTTSPRLVAKLAKHLVDKAKLMGEFKTFLKRKHGHEINFHIVLVGQGELPRHTLHRLAELGAQVHFQELQSL